MEREADIVFGNRRDEGGVDRPGPEECLQGAHTRPAVDQQLEMQAQERFGVAVGREPVTEDREGEVDLAGVEPAIDLPRR